MGRQLMWAELHVVVELKEQGVDGLDGEGALLNEMLCPCLEQGTEVVTAECVGGKGEVCSGFMDHAELQLVLCTYQPDVSGALEEKLVPAPARLEHVDCHHGVRVEVNMAAFQLRGPEAEGHQAV